MAELSVVVALLVVYNIYLTLKINSMRKQILKQTGALTTEVLHQCMPLMAEVFNRDLNKAVHKMEGTIITYIKEHTSVPPPTN